MTLYESTDDVRCGVARTVRPSTLVLDRELLFETTRSLVGTVEWATLFFQAVTLAGSALYDAYTLIGFIIIIVLIPAHLALIPTYMRRRGPFSRGGLWILIGVLESFAMYAVIAVLLSVRGTYGSLPFLPASPYAAGTWMLLAFYPWSPIRWARIRPMIDAVLFALFYGYLLAIIWMNNGTVTWSMAKNALAAMLWLVAAYVIGKSLGWLSNVSAARQLEVQRRNFNEFFDFLHSHVKAGIAAIRADLPVNQVRARDRLRELEEAVSDYRVELILALEQVPLAALFSERVRAFAGAVEIARTPRVGALTVPRRVGIVVSRGLGDLLTNAVVYGATVVNIEFEFHPGSVCLRIADDGPGFPVEILDDESRSLYRLRQAARDLGGDLTKTDVPPHGSRLELTMPLRRTPETT